MAIKITFQELVDEFSASTGRTKAFSNQFIKDIFTTVQEGLRRDENVNIKGLGIFKLQNVAERETVNPKTGRQTLIEAHKKVVFKPEKALREAVNEKYAKLKPKKIKKKETKPAPTPTPIPVIKKAVEDRPLTFGEPTPVPKKAKPTPPPTPPHDNKKILPTFIIEEKKKKSAWRWILPLFLLILIQWKTWHFGEIGIGVRIPFQVNPLSLRR
jgi:nucleoid DNA-binding protein